MKVYKLAVNLALCQIIGGVVLSIVNSLTRLVLLSKYFEIYMTHHSAVTTFDGIPHLINVQGVVTAPFLLPNCWKHPVVLY